MLLSKSSGDSDPDMTTWYYDKSEFKRTPSVKEGISYETEQRYRREGARFIIKVGSKMNLRYDTMATGVVYFHRFYMCQSFKEFPRFVTACCCLFLAGKVEETPKKCKDIIKIARTYLTDQQFATFGEDPKEEVLTLERILLQTIHFDLQVDHPYGYLLKYAKSLKGDKDKLQKMVQMAWTFINDSLCTTICLQWEPEIIAIALMFLAGKLSKFEVVDWQGRTSKHNKWWDMFVEDVTVDLLEDICHQVLDLYSMPIPETPQDSPPASPIAPVTPGSVTQAHLPNVSPSLAHSVPASSMNQPRTSVVPQNIPPQLASFAATHPSYRFPNPIQAAHTSVNQVSVVAGVSNSVTPPVPPNLPPPPLPPVPPTWDAANLMGLPSAYQKYFQNFRPHGYSGAQNAPPISSVPPMPQFPSFRKM